VDVYYARPKSKEDFWEYRFASHRLVSGGTIRLWRYSTVVNRPKFPYTSYTFTGKLDLGDVHLAGVHLTGMYLGNVYLIGVYLIGVQPIGVHHMA